MDTGNESSMILSAAKCVVNGQSNMNSDCRLSFQYKKETVLYFLKNLLGHKEFNKFYKLTLKNGSKKGTNSDMVNITLDLKPLFNNNGSKNSSNSDLMTYWYSFYIFISIVLIAFLAPLWPLVNYIYIITLASMFIFSITIYLQLLKLTVFSLVYLFTLKKYKFWLLPNLNRDAGLLGTFWPLYEISLPMNESINQTDLIDDNQEANSMNQHLNENSNDYSSENQSISEKSNNDELNLELMNKKLKRSKSNNKLERIDLKQIKLADKTTSNESQDILSDTMALSNMTEVNNELKDNCSADQCSNQSNTTGSTITKFIGNDRLPTITTTPPINSNFSLFESASRRLDTIDLNNADIDKNSGEEMRNVCLDDYASISPVISYLNVNEVRRRQHLPARTRIASNRSDDGFEILNNDFLRNTPPKDDDLFVCSKQKF